MEDSFVFVSQIIPQELLAKDFDKQKNVVDIAGNNYYTALVEGIAENGYSIEAVSYIKDTDYQKLGLANYNGVNYRFKKFRENSLNRFLYLFVDGFAQVWSFKKRNKKNNTYAIFNVLRISSALGGLLACKLYQVKTIGIVTDVPGYRLESVTSKGLIEKMADKIGQSLAKKFDAYVVLSDPMKKVIEIGSKPCVRIEGIYDETTCEDKEDFSSDAIFRIIYAGSLHYQYGIMNLVNAIKELNIPNIHLAVYGDGEAKEEIIKTSRENASIEYKGMISRQKLLVHERKASLLVNPRPINDKYVQYSFPSKNMEYIASGTPTLLTNIPSLPDDYKRFVYIAEDNSVDCLKTSIKLIFENWNKSSFKEIGKKARAFILSQKNKKVQSLKLIEMCKKI